METCSEYVYRVDCPLCTHTRSVIVFDSGGNNKTDDLLVCQAEQNTNYIVYNTDDRFEMT